MDLTTSLPPPEEALEDRIRNTMSIRRVVVTDQPHKMVQTTLSIAWTHQGDRKTIPLESVLYTIDSDDVRGYVPTKSLISFDEDQNDINVQMVFFVSPSLPAQVRPFGEGKTHVLLFHVLPYVSVEYDIEKRILIDQQIADGQVYYIVVFGDKQYDEIVVKELEKQQ